MTAADALARHLKTLDGQSYRAYQSLRGEYSFPGFQLHVDHVQGDPFAALSQVRVWVDGAIAQFPADLLTTATRRMAVADFVVRQFHHQAQQWRRSQGSGKSGLIEIARPSQAVLVRSACTVSAAGIELRVAVGLPAFGRRIAGHQAAELLCQQLPMLVERSAEYKNLAAAALRHQVEVVEDAEAMRSQLRERGLVAFVADGSVLPRRSGVDDRPLQEDAAVRFESPESLRVGLTCPNRGSVTGMGIPQGITVIVGGGYHGKSTLLRAIERGVYPHIPGDGREAVVTDPAAVKVRAEDGRSVVGVDISPFINHLPQGKSTRHFSTPNASGSTSQAANIMEALEAGARVLLVDEDTSATNFMIRDRRMQALIAKTREPITPFIDKVRQLYEEHGVSTILVMGGSGDYFDVADTVIALDSYRPEAVTEQAKAVAQRYNTERLAEGGDRFDLLTPRRILPQGIDPSRGRKAVNLKVRSTDEIRFGEEEIDLSAVEQIVEPGQIRAIARALVYLQTHYLDGQRSLPEVLDAVMDDLAQAGLDCLDDRLSGNLVQFRPLELAAALNRLRTLQVAPV
ncbi:MAG: ABC-ATPase domain-containing protein [Leptolyngbyaceae cyanobacterium T60_A2020_046]|nr:ABC-ATPase domain-containing protein [Leptolyngbyaceae cyanobacterium T60_A2020_046]